MRVRLAACGCRVVAVSSALKVWKSFAKPNTCTSITNSKRRVTGIPTIGPKVVRLINQDMKIIVLGGCGFMGSEVTRDLARTSDFEEIVIAEADLERAQALATELGGDRVRA